MASSSSLRLVSFNCRGWNSGSLLLNDLSDSFDICFVQEHWLFDFQLSSLSFCDDFNSVGVSGMSDSLLLGRPYGGCGLIYRKSLTHLITHHSSNSDRFCAISVHLNGISLLFICVYFPTNYHTLESKNAFTDLLGVLAGFIDTISFDHVLIAGDFNVDLDIPSDRSSLFINFLEEHSFICLDRLPLSRITHTCVHNSGGHSTWIDHF